MANQTWEEADIATKRAVPEGLWVQCAGCGETVFGKTLEQNLEVCPKCDHHHRHARIERRRDEQSSIQIINDNDIRLNFCNDLAETLVDARIFGCVSLHAEGMSADG